MTSEKFCVKWNDFQENIRASFSSLREDQDFTDVTMVCDDNQTLEAHKVILYQDLSYDESFSGQPGAWRVKKIFFICMQSQNFKETSY